MVSRRTWLNVKIFIFYGLCHNFGSKTLIGTKPSALPSSLVRWRTILPLVWFQSAYLNQSCTIVVKFSHFMDYGITLAQIRQLEPNQVHYHRHWWGSELYCAWFGSNRRIWTKGTSFSSKCENFHISWTMWHNFGSNILIGTKISAI